MKRKLLLFPIAFVLVSLLWPALSKVQAQDIVALEYFLNTDPGFGNGTNVPITSGNVVEKTFQIDLNSVNPGFNKLFFRVKDADGTWSLRDLRDIFKLSLPATPPSLPEIVTLEYFFNSDPGFGNGTSLPLTPGNTIHESYLIDISSLTPGFHKLFFRVKDADGLWSLRDLRDIFKLQLPATPPSLADIVALEYFFDTDPGFGNGISLPITAGKTIDQSYLIDITSLTPGFHKLFFRVMDANGVWSHRDLRDIFKLQLPATPPSLVDIVALEYFFDTDPGFGNGTSLPITAGKTIDESYLIDITSLTPGFHKLFFRVKDANGVWSLRDLRDIFKLQLPASPPSLADIVALEYFFDTDPGFGNGTSLPITAGTNIDESYLIDITSLTPGFHKLFFRVKDANGIWSHRDLRDIFKLELPTPPATLPDVVAMEYFFNTDPGFGNGTPLSVSAGTTIDESYLIDVTSLPIGSHKLFIRAQDANGTWSLTDMQEFVKTDFAIPGNPVAYYPFNGNANDYSGNDYHGVANGATLTTDRFGNPNSAYYFNGTSAWVNIPFIAPFLSNSHTISAWVQAETGTNNRRIVAMGATGGNAHFALNASLPSSVNKASVQFTQPNASNPVAISTTTLTDGNWYHVAGVIDESDLSLKIYINGELQSTTFATQNPITGNQHVNIGRFDATWGEYFKGKIDDVIIYNEALTSQQILSLYDPDLACENPNNGGVIAASHTICSGAFPNPFTSTSPASGHAGTLQYRWQISSNGIDFNDIPGANAESYTHNIVLNATTWFRRLAKVSCEPDWGGAAVSNVVQVSVEDATQYRTVASGNWNNPAIWEIYDGSNWVPAAEYPGQSTVCFTSTATILAGHSVTVTADVSFGNVVVATGATLTVQQDIAFTIFTGSTFTVNGTLIMPSTSVIAGAGNFTLASGATMHIGSAQGITVSTLVGNIQVTGIRFYASGAHYFYIGISDQFTGNGLTQNTPANVTFSANGFTVSLSAHLSISGNIHIAFGSLNANGFNITLAGNWTNDGIFVYGTSTVYFICLIDVYVSGGSFYNVVFGGSGTVIATGSITIYGYITINYIFNGGSYTHYVYGNWVNNGTYIYGTSTVYFVPTGAISISGGSFYNVVFGGSGTISAGGGISFYGNVSIPNYFNAGSYNHYVYGNWSASGTFIPGGSTFNFVGSGGSTIGGGSFNNIVFGGTGTNTATGPIVFNGNVSITNHFDAGSYTHMVYGNWTVTGTFVYGTSTIDFHGSGNALISGGSFYNVIFCGTGTNTATGPMIFYGDVYITWHFNAATFTHLVYGSWILTGTFVHSTSTIQFVGSILQNVSAGNFYHVVFGGTGTVIATGSLSIFGNVLISNYFGGGSFTHLVYGNWTNNGTFAYGTSTIHFTGSGSASIGPGNFYNVIFGGSGTNTATGAMYFYGNVVINGHFGGGSFTHRVYGNWTNNGTFAHGTSTIDFHGSDNALIGPSNFYNVIFCGTGTNTATGSLTIYGNVLITWHFDAGSYVHYVYGNWTNNAVFIAGTSTIHFVGTLVQIIGGTHHTYFYWLIVNNIHGIHLHYHITVNYRLTLTIGVVNGGSYLLTIPVGGTIIGGSATAYINGRLALGFGMPGTGFFPVGSASNYRPFTFTYHTLSGTSLVEAELIESQIPGTIPGNIIPLGRYWALSQSGGFDFTCSLTADDDDLGNYLGRVRMLKCDVNLTVHPTTAPNYTNINPFTSVSCFALCVEPCTEPDIPVLSDDESICSGESVTLEVISGDLNDADNWVWYAGACGTNQVGTGTSVLVSPTVTTTYYVRGESACLVPGVCASVTVTVKPLPVVQCPDGFCITPEEEPFILSGGTPTGGVYSGPGVSLNQTNQYVFTPSIAGEGSHVITYTYTDPITNCENECSFVITVGHIPYNLTVVNHTIPAATDTCFNACNTLTVENVVAEPTSSARFIAGQRVILKPGVHFKEGSDVHVFISTDGIFCEEIPLVASKEEEELADNDGIHFEADPAWNADKLFRIYPNPTTGLFTLEFSAPATESETRIEIYGMMGELVEQRVLKGGNNYVLDLSSQARGIYILRIVHENESYFEKIIKQ